MDKLTKLKAKYPQYIADVRGAGLMIGMEMADADKKPNAAITDKIQKKALERNVLLLTCGHEKNVVRFIAPTTVTEKEIDTAISVIDGILAEE